MCLERVCTIPNFDLYAGVSLRDILNASDNFRHVCDEAWEESLVRNTGDVDQVRMTREMTVSLCDSHGTEDMVLTCVTMDLMAGGNVVAGRSREVELEI